MLWIDAFGGAIVEKSSNPLCLKLLIAILSYL